MNELLKKEKELLRNIEFCEYWSERGISTDESKFFLYECKKKLRRIKLNKLK